MASKYWTHRSVRRLAGTEHPVAAVTQCARRLVLDAMAKGWTGPPFDPFALADLIGVDVVPAQEVSDARTLPAGDRGFRIEYNPLQPAPRVRFSVAHELAHTLFPDCRERVRNRAKREHLTANDWQLEMLCNIAAAELLMPIGSFPELTEEALGIDHLMELRKSYEVSAEAILLRAVRLANAQCVAFAASCMPPFEGRYQLDYAIASPSWSPSFAPGIRLPADSAVAQCTAIGFTSKSAEHWPGVDEKLHVECVGIPPYPMQVLPRVVGVARTLRRSVPESPSIKYLKGDATRPRLDGSRIVVHIVNDKARRWGGSGFAQALRRAWPSVHDDYVAWVEKEPRALKLGSVHFAHADDDLLVASIVAQRGYGRAVATRIRYDALLVCLTKVADFASNGSYSIHMPRIGTGQAGGNWSVIRELVEDTLLHTGLSVTVYDLPETRPARRDEREQLAFPS